LLEAFEIKGMLLNAISPTTRRWYRRAYL